MENCLRGLALYCVGTGKVFMNTSINGHKVLWRRTLPGVYEMTLFEGKIIGRATVYKIIKDECRIEVEY